MTAVCLDTRYATVILLVVAVVASVDAYLQQKKPSALDLMAAAQAGLGGAQKLASIKSLMIERQTTRLSAILPSKFQIQTRSSFGVHVETLDSGVLWRRQPPTPAGAPVTPRDQGEEIRLLNDRFTEFTLVHLLRTPAGSRLDIVAKGVQHWPGATGNVVHLSSRRQEVALLMLDVDTGLPIAIARPRVSKTKGKGLLMIYLKDYRTVEGLRFPFEHKYEFNVPGQPPQDYGTLKTNRLEINSVSRSDFDRPKDSR